MKLLTDLFSTDYGLMSIIGIAFMLGMGVFFESFSNARWTRTPATQASRFSRTGHVQAACSCSGFKIR